MESGATLEEVAELETMLPLIGTILGTLELSKIRDHAGPAMHFQPTPLLRLQLPSRLATHISVSPSSKSSTVVATMRHNTTTTMDAKEATCLKCGGSRWTEEP